LSAAAAHAVQIPALPSAATGRSVGRREKAIFECAFIGKYPC